MTKGKAKPAVAVKPMAILTNQEDTNIYTSTRGVNVPLKPVSQFLLDAIRTSREEVPVPTYEVDLPGGDKEILDLDEESAESRGRVEEWKKYLKDVDKEKREFGVRFNDLVVFEGVDLEVPGEGSDWAKKCEVYKLKVPEDPIKRKVFYVNNEYLGTYEEMGELIAAIYQVSRFAPEVIQKMRATFRRTVEEQKNKILAQGEVPVANE